MNKIPDKFNVGGQEIQVRPVSRCENNAAGLSFLCGGYIEIASIVNKDDCQSEGSKKNTFFHELTHCILDTMGEKELSGNEKFVNCFAGFLTEAMGSVSFESDVRWRRIRKGEHLPCPAYLWSVAFRDYPNSFEGKLVPNIQGCMVGADTWYLPVEDIANLKKED